MSFKAYTPSMSDIIMAAMPGCNTDVNEQDIYMPIFTFYMSYRKCTQLK